MAEKIFDAHVHVYPDAIADRARVALGKFYNFPVPGVGTYEGYLAECRENETSGFLVFSVATTAHQVKSINDYIADRMHAARGEGFEAVGFAAMHQDFEDVETELDRAISLGLTGIKIHPDIQRFDLLDSRMYRICEAAEGRLIINFHMGDDREEYRYSEPKKLAKLLERFPKLTVIASHLGGYKAWDEAAAYLYGNPMVWYDNSSALWALTPERAVEITRGCGVDRVMFGTDFPVMKIRQYMDLFDEENWGQAEREAILYGNAKRLFSL